MLRVSGLMFAVFWWVGVVFGGLAVVFRGVGLWDMIVVGWLWFFLGFGGIVCFRDLLAPDGLGWFSVGFGFSWVWGGLGFLANGCDEFGIW